MERDLSSHLRHDVSVAIKPVEEARLAVDITSQREKIFADEIEAIDFFDKEAQKFRLIGWSLRGLIVMGLVSSVGTTISGIQNRSIVEVGGGVFIGVLSYVVRTLNQKGVMEKMEEDLLVAQALRDYEASISLPLDE